MLTTKARVAKTVRRVRQRLTGMRGHAVPAFVLGAQRSGTNMLMDVLGRCPYVEAFNETDPEAFDHYRLKPPASLVALVERSFARVALFKPICDSQKARVLLDVFPDGKVVWIYRDYRDVVNSALRQFQDHTKYLHYVLHEPDVAGWRLENVSDKSLDLVRQFHARGIDDASARALIWVLRNEQFFQNELDSDDRAMLVRYESLVQDPATEFEALFRFLDLPFDPSCVLRVSPHSINKHASPDIHPEIAALCADMTARLDRRRSAGPARR
ncbi:MAG: sulfotransferase [Phycisphaerae bacterium]